MSFNRKFILKAGRYSFLELISNQGIGVIIFFILVRILSKEDFGIWVLYLSSITLIEMARVGFVKNALLRYTNTHTNYRIFRSTSLFIGLLFFLITTILIQLPLALYVGPIIWNAPVMKLLFLINIPGSLLLVFYSHYKNLQQSQLKFKESLYCSLSRRVPFLLLIIFSVTFLNIDLIMLVNLQNITLLFAVIISFSYVQNELSYKLHFNKKVFKELFIFGRYTLGTSLNSMILRNIDQYMLGIYSEKFVVALYSTAIRITNLVEIPVNAMSSIVYPKSASTSDLHELKLMYEKSVAIILCFVLPIVLIVYIFPDLFILLIAGRDYLTAVPFLKLTILFALVVPFIRQAGTILDSMGKPKINFYLTLFSSVLNILMNYIFITGFGPIGAAYGTLISYIVILLINQFFLRKYFDVRIFNIIYMTYGYYKKAIIFLVNKGIAIFR